MESMVMNLQIFKNDKGGDSSTIFEEETNLFLSDVHKDGTVEVRFEWPLVGADDVFLTLDLGALVTKLAQINGNVE